MENKGLPPHCFTTLSWDDIVSWAGVKIADRGRAYQRDGRVKDLATTESGRLIASVLGSERYDVLVSIDRDGVLESLCTCPYGFDCKHGVATVLEYLSRIKQGRRIPMADAQDERILRVNADAPDEDTGHKSDACQSEPSEDNRGRVENLLKKKTKGQLITMLQELAEKFPEIESLLLNEAQMRDGDIAALTRRLKREIIRVSSEPAWQHHWDDEGHIPDYSGIRDKLASLLEAGYADEVLALGKELFDRGISQVEMSDDEGETADEIATCLALLPQALQASSLPETERLLWALDLELADSYSICGEISNYLRQEHPAPSWDAVADILLKRLEGKACQPDDYNSSYQRTCLSNWIIHAMEQAGRQEEIIPFCAAEAPITNSYERLVKRLMDRKRYEDAEQWIRKGIAATGKAYSGTASRLRDMLVEIRMLQQDWNSVALLQIEEFVRYPSVNSFEECTSAAKHLGAWTKIRDALLAYLASGTPPWKHPEWPLSGTEKHALPPPPRNTFPMVYELIQIAIHEKNAEEVLRWYAMYRNTHDSRYGALDEKVATALAAHDPKRAVFIWRVLAEQQIARVTPNAYYEAAGYLRKAGKVMMREKKYAEWQQYLTSLRTTHCRKKRLLEILDTLSARPIVEKGK